MISWKFLLVVSLCMNALNVGYWLLLHPNESPLLPARDADAVVADEDSAFSSTQLRGPLVMQTEPRPAEDASVGALSWSTSQSLPLRSSSAR